MGSAADSACSKAIHKFRLVPTVQGTPQKLGPQISSTTRRWLTEGLMFSGPWSMLNRVHSYTKITGQPALFFGGCVHAIVISDTDIISSNTFSTDVYYQSVQINPQQVVTAVNPADPVCVCLDTLLSHDGVIQTEMGLSLLQKVKLQLITTHT